MKQSLHIAGLFSVLILILTINVPLGHSIGCYTCKSGGGLSRDEACESAKKHAPYTTTCIPTEEPVPGTAIYCGKVIGRELNTTKPMVMRGCSYRYRHSTCGSKLTFDGKTVKGCIFSCRTGDFCNGNDNSTSTTQKTT